MVQKHFKLEEATRPEEEDELMADAEASDASLTPLQQKPTVNKDLKGVTARSKNVMYAALSPKNMNPRQIEVALKICGVLGLSPMVVNSDGITPGMLNLESIHLVFITPENLLESTQNFNRRQLLKLANDLEQATLVLLLEDVSNIQCLVELPAGLPVFICHAPSQDACAPNHRCATDDQQTFLEHLKARLDSVTPSQSRRTFSLSERMTSILRGNTAD